MHFNQRSCACIPRVCFRSLGRFQRVDMCPSMDPVPFPRETREESSKGDEGWGQTGRLQAVKKGVGVWSSWETRTQRRPHPRQHCQCAKIKPKRARSPFKLPCDFVWERPHHPYTSANQIAQQIFQGKGSPTSHALLVNMLWQFPWCHTGRPRSITQQQLLPLSSEVFFFA